jgi:hypothetical protein
MKINKIIESNDGKLRIELVRSPIGDGLYISMYWAGNGKKMHIAMHEDTNTVEELIEMLTYVVKIRKDELAELEK